MTELSRLNQDDLVGENPRDSLILLRENKLREVKEAKRAQAAVSCDGILRKYSKQFFKDEDVFNKLNLLQKKELAKFCASYCRKWLWSSVSIVGSSLLVILGLGIFYSVVWLFALFPWLFVFIITFVSIGVTKDRKGHVNIEHFLPFLMAYGEISQADKGKNSKIEPETMKNE